MRALRSLILILCLISCGGDSGSEGGGSGGGSSSSFGTIQVEVTSDEVSTLSTIGTLNVACSIVVGATTHNGTCYTPESLKAKVARINLSNSFGGSPARLIDFSAAPSDSPFGGPNGVLGMATYDFAATGQSTNSYSDDNIQDSGESYFDNLTMEVGAIELKHELPAGNGNITNKFWTIRYLLLPQNPLDIPAIDTCATDTSIRDQITASGNLYGAPNNFQQGDILVCQKSLSTDTCADSDFQWINSADGALSGTRPASPVKVEGTYAFQDNSCEEGGGNLVMGGSSFKAQLSQAVRINKSRASEDCLFKYNYQTNCTTTGSANGSCSDTAQEGFGINVSVDFDLDNSLFVEDTVDLDTDTEAAILQNLHLMLPKPLFVENNKAAVGTGDNTTLNAAISITVDNAIADTILQSRDEDPADYDGDYCFIPQETGGN